MAPTISWTVFDGMGRRAAVASAREDMKASVEAYNLSVVTAVQEVENAMALYLSALKQVDALAEVVKQAKEAFDLFRPI